MGGREDREARGIKEEGLREGGMEEQRSLSNINPLGEGSSGYYI